jgi:ABC-type glycerol-3-phosphate transport system permease component
VNALHTALLAAFAAFVLLLFINWRWATRYARFAVLTAVAALMLAPFAWLVCAAFKDPAVLNEYTFLPPISKWSSQTLNLTNFRVLFEDKETVEGPVSFWRYAANSVFLACATTIVSLTFSSMAGYALAKYQFRGRNAVMTFMLASLTIPAVVLLAPAFEVIWRLGMLDSFKGLILPAAVSVFGIFLFRQAMIGIPDDVIEAGRIDGCGEFRIYLTLMMPLVRPVTAAFCLMTFLATWNAFLVPNIFLQSPTKSTLPIVLNQYIGVYRQQYGVFLAGTLLAIVPPAALFLTLQREFISGLTSGAVKQ